MFLLRNRGIFAAAVELITDNLVAYYDASILASYPGSGSSWSDISANSNTLSASGPTFNSTNKWFTLDGSNDKWTRSTNDFFRINNNNQYTIEVWVRPHELGSQQTLLSNGTPRNALYYVFNPAAANGAIFFGSGSGSWGWTDNTGAHAPGSVALNQWQQVCITRNDSQIRYWVNGQNVYLNSSFNWGSGNSGTFYVGTYFDNTNNDGSWFDGDVAIMRFYKGLGMSSEQINQNFKFDKGRFGI